VDWEGDGARIKATPGPRVQNEQHYFKEGWTYSYMARGSLGLRGVFAHKSPAVVARSDDSATASVGNCRFASLAGRAISASIQLPEGCVSRIPVPEHTPGILPQLGSASVALKEWLVAQDPTERSFDPSRLVGSPEGERYGSA
jgi:hypothetical protein